MTEYPAVLVRRPGPRPSVLDGFTPNQGDKARLLLADSGLAPHGHPRCFWVVSADGERTYLAHPDGCTCPAGLHAVRCYHRAAVRLWLAAEDQPRLARNAAGRHWRAASRWERAGQPIKAQAARELARACAQLARDLAAGREGQVA